MKIRRIIIILIASVLYLPLALGSGGSGGGNTGLADLHRNIQTYKEARCAFFDGNGTACVLESFCRWDEVEEKCTVDPVEIRRDALNIVGFFLGYSAASIGFVYLGVNCLSYFLSTPSPRSSIIQAAAGG